MLGMAIKVILLSLWLPVLVLLVSVVGFGGKAVYRYAGADFPIGNFLCPELALRRSADLGSGTAPPPFPYSCLDLWSNTGSSYRIYLDCRGCVRTAVNCCCGGDSVFAGLGYPAGDAAAAGIIAGDFFTKRHRDAETHRDISAKLRVSVSLVR